MFNQQLTRRKIWYFGTLTAVVALVLSLVLAEGLARVILGRRYGWQAISGGGKDGAFQHDALLGWKRVPGKVIRGRQPKPVTTNMQGFRAIREYSVEVPAGRYRIVFLGDSFTHGIGGDDETYPAQLEALAPAIEAVNMGRGAYGIDQLYLSYQRDGTFLKTNLLVFAFIEDDFGRMTSDTFRTLRPKPQLVVRGNALAQLNVPVPRWDTFPENTALFKVLHKGWEQRFSHYDLFPVVERIFDDLQALSRKRHQELVLVYLPSYMDSPGSDGPPREIARRVQQIAADRQIHFWNLTSMFHGLSASEIAADFLPDEHYSARGNHLAATTLLRELRKQFPDVPR